MYNNYENGKGYSKLNYEHFSELEFIVNVKNCLYNYFHWLNVIKTCFPQLIFITTITFN